MENIQNKTGKWKNLVRFLLIGLWLIIILFILFIVNARCIGYFTDRFISSSLHWTLIIFSFLISLLIEILIVYIIISRREKNIWWNNKLKKCLRISLIINFLLFLISGFVFFTKIWIIPNRLWINDCCIDCKWDTIFLDALDGQFMWIWGVPKINWNICCKWTYNYHIRVIEPIEKMNEDGSITITWWEVSDY